MRAGSRLALAAPALLALVPMLVVTRGNVGEYTWGQFAAVALLSALCGALAYAAAAVVLRHRTQSETVLVSSIAVLWLLGGPLAADRLGVLPPRFGIPLLGAAAAGGAWAVLRRPGGSPALARGVGIFALALVASTLAAARLADARVAAAVAESQTARELLGPLPAPRGRARPDIYVIILDNLANERVQRDVFGRSNRAFEDSLRTLGFTLPRETRSNYSWTPHSVASLLDLGHVRGLEHDLGSASTEWAVLYRLVQENRASRWLHQAGYTIYFEPSVGFSGTAWLKTPHVTYGDDGDGALLAAVARNRLLSAAVHNSVPGRLLERVGVHPYHHAARLRALRTVGDLAGRPGPKFVLAHSLVAHDPFVFDGSCRPQTDRETRARGDSAAYLAVVQCTERLVLAAVTRILAASPAPPLIILQADHGPMSLHPPSTEAEAITPAQAMERAGAFGAYLLPGPAAPALPDAVTPANVLRFVFREYLGAPIEPVSDASYYASLMRPFHFVDVTPYVTAGARTDTVIQLTGPVRSVPRP